MRASRLFRVVLAGMLALAGVYCMAQSANMGSGAPPTDVNNAPPALQTRDARYLVNKGDVLQLTFVFTPEYNQTVTVQADGYITLQGVGDVKVEGQSLPQVTEAVRGAYAKTLHDPAVTVFPQNTVQAYFIAGGEVAKPGKYNFSGDTTVAQAVQIAGGFTADAKHSQVVLFRRMNNDWVQGTTIDVKHMLKSGNLAEDLHLQPGDMLYVPKNFISKTQPWLTPWSQFVKLNFLGSTRIP